MTLSFRAFLMAFVLFALSSGAKAQVCADSRPSKTKINVDLKLPDPVYDLKHSIHDINKGQSNFDDWITKNGMQKIWKSSDLTTLGYAEGAAGVLSGIGYEVWPYHGKGVYYCPYITRIDVSMMFRTRIVIPNNFKKGGCRFNLVHEHEFRHYKTNRETALEFVKKLYRDLPIIVKEIESAQPYVEGKDLDATLDTFKASVQDAVEIYVIKGMGKELERRNNLIDTPEEYASSGPKMDACKD